MANDGVIRCICGYEGGDMEDWLCFRAIAAHDSKYKAELLEIKGLQPPLNGINIYVCPRCGTARVNVYETTAREAVLHRHPFKLPGT
jgi:acetone carboxylase gamma subunit